MKYHKIIGILLIVLALSVMTAAPAQADQPVCRSYPYDFVHSHTVEFSPVDWSFGSHVYQMRITLPDSFVLELDPVYFDVTEDSPLYPGQVFFRFWGLAWLEGTASAIHPDHDTVMQLSWAYEEFMTMKEIKAFRDAMVVEFKWDGGEYMTIPAGPVVSFCSVRNNGSYLRTWGGNWK